uniref:non-specific serine/threonine protein kinase n=2 Tax=Oryzias sinensis TaxID=183150 RepID=A0A8C7YEF1_9TELE
MPNFKGQKVKVRFFFFKLYEAVLPLWVFSFHVFTSFYVLAWVNVWENLTGNIRRQRTSFLEKFIFLNTNHCICWEMSSRRTTARYNYGNGRSSFGDDTNGSNRSGSRSYLSNVRPENRSNLCSVMAQLAEETQPSFMTTLKSKAVSENCNVKFSCVVTGYPVPQVTWYKDDTQLDRLCGLPKYEVFHNGQNHSLQIYNCTVEDAAIYQASAINSKGIVSCSGVLEVGEMNEFKIHQKYFAKLKQKSASRQTEGKENQEPIRTISPDRTQRKRRSTMEAFLNTPSSTEDDISEENHESVDIKAEDRLQEPTVQEPEMKPAASAKRGGPAVTTGQFNSDTGSKSGTYIYDPTDKVFTAHQSKTPSVKKKIKISSIAKVGEEETGENLSSETWPKDGKNSSSVTVCKETAPINGNSEDVMEVEKVTSSVVDSAVENKNEEQRKKEEVLTKNFIKDDNLCNELSTEKKHLTAAAHQLTFPGHIGPGSGGERPVKESSGKDNEEHSKMKNPILSTKKRSSVKSTLLSMAPVKENRTEQSQMKETDLKTEASSGQFFKHISSESKNTSCNNENLPKRPCEPTRTHPSEKETSFSREMESVSSPALPSEVIQTYTKRNRNDAALKPELPPDKYTVGSPLQQKTDTIQISTLGGDPHGLMDKMAINTCSTSIESSQRLSAVMTHKKKLPQPSETCDSPGSHVDRAVKTVEGTEIQDHMEVEVNEVGTLLRRTKDLAPAEKMETETAGPHMTEQTKKEKAGNAEHKDYTKTEMMKENNCLNVQNSKSNLHENIQETAPQDLARTSGNTDLLKEMVDFNKIQKPATKVISIAELLRSQIKALDLTSTVSVSSITLHSNLVQDPATTEVCKKSKDDKTVKDGIETKSSPDVPATKTIKETLLEIYQQLIETDQKQNLTATAASTNQHLHKSDHAPNITGGDANDEQVNRNSREHNKEAMDLSKERDALTVASPTKTISPDNSPLLDSNKGFLHILPTVSNLPERVIPEAGSPLTQTHVESNIPEATILKHPEGEPVQVQSKGLTYKLIPEIRVNSKKEGEVAKTSMINLTGRCKMEDHETNTVSIQPVQMPPTDSGLANVTQGDDINLIQQEGSVVKIGFRSESCVEPTPEPSPQLKRSDNICVIPSATPQELASGARRKVPAPKLEDTTAPTDGEHQRKEAVPTNSVTQSLSPSLSRHSPLLQPTVEPTSTAERLSPLLTRRRTASENLSPRQPVIDESNTNEQRVDKHSPFKGK